MRIRMLKDGARRLAPMARYLQGETENDRRRTALNPIRANYHTPRWRALRWEVLVSAHFRCAICGRGHETLTTACDALAPLGRLDSVKGKAPDFVADHIRPHRGDESLFWDRDNLQCLCAGCHNSAKQREESGNYSVRPDWVRRSAIPLTLIAGPPLSGKSTFASAHAASGDIVIDLDVIACEVARIPFTHTWDREAWLGQAIRRRNTMLDALSQRSSGRAWAVATAPRLQDRLWWSERLGARVVVLEVPAHECWRRAVEAGRDTPQTRAGIDQWWREYEPAAGDDGRAG